MVWLLKPAMKFGIIRGSMFCVLGHIQDGIPMCAGAKLAGRREEGGSQPWEKYILLLGRDFRYPDGTQVSIADIRGQNET